MFDWAWQLASTWTAEATAASKDRSAISGRVPAGLGLTSVLEGCGASTLRPSGKLIWGRAFSAAVELGKRPSVPELMLM